MLRSDLQALWLTARPTLTQHWQSCASSGLPHTAVSEAAVAAAFEQFLAALSTPNLEVPDGALRAIQALYARLDVINDEQDGGLLETDERELLVPIVIDAARLVGLDPAAYDGEPGGEFRNF